jgi:hypothetical protein
VGPRAGLDHLEKKKFLTLPGLEFRPFVYPSRSQSLYNFGTLFKHEVKVKGKAIPAQAVEALRVARG